MPNILVVCTANRCRSPLAAALLQRALDETATDNSADSPWHVSSAGVWAHGGLPATTLMQQVARDTYAIDLAAHRAREVNAEILHTSDLILVMEQGQKEALTIEFPDRANRVHLLSALSGLPYDIADPTGDGLVQHQATAEELASLIETAIPRIRALLQPQ